MADVQSIHDECVAAGASCGDDGDEDDQRKAPRFDDETARAIQKCHGIMAAAGASCMTKVARTSLRKAAPLKKLMNQLPADEALDIVKAELFRKCTSPEAAHRMVGHGAQNWFGGTGNLGPRK